MRFTIRSVMLAIVFVAILLALPDGWGLIATAFLPTGLIVIGTQWILFRGHRKMASRGFFAAAALCNLLYAWCCMTPDTYLVIPLFIAWILWIFPAVTGLGGDWVILTSRQETVPRPIGLRWLLVVALALLPMFTLISWWPLYLSFLAARPTLDHLADQVAAGSTVTFPQRAGPYWLAVSRVDPVSGSVALIIDPNPNGPTGFVREAGGGPPNRALIVGSDVWIDLFGGWSYRVED